MNTTMFRQGDVLITQVDSVPADAKPLERDNDRVILAYGEVTGHAHAITDRNAVLMSFGTERFLRSNEPMGLYHEEHDPIQLPAGSYKITQQREYTPEEIRNVAD